MIGFDLLSRSDKKKYIGTKIKSVEKNYKGIDDNNYRFLIAVNFPNIRPYDIKCFICDQDYTDYDYVYTYQDQHDLLCMESKLRANRFIINTCLKCKNLYTLPWTLFCGKSILPYKSINSAMDHRELKPLTFYVGILDEYSILNQIPKDVILLIIYIYRDIRSL